MFEGGIKTVKACLDVLGHVFRRIGTRVFWELLCCVLRGGIILLMKEQMLFYCGDHDARYVFLLGGERFAGNFLADMRSRYETGGV